MGRILIILIAVGLLLFPFGCSSTKTNTSNHDLLKDYAVTSKEPAVGTEPDWPKTQEGVSKKDMRVLSSTDAVPNADDDDDITALLGQDYDKDFDIPIVFNDAVKYFIQYFTTEKRKVFGNWLKRARYYVPVITEILKEKGLPEDLVYLAMIESGFNPKAYSPASASGPWQFIYATGERYGLRVNNWVDERRDPEKSTIAATKYLRDLFNQFGCWYLAAAGYNAGEGRVEKAIARHNTSDFWELVKYNTLPKETREYIPKLIAAAIIAKDPERFGFGSITYDQPVKFLRAKVPAASPVSAIAKASSLDVQHLRSINPEILTGITPPDIHDYYIKLPNYVDTAVFHRNLENALSTQKRIRGVTAYKVKKGDTLGRIAKRHRIIPQDIALVNGPGDEMKVKPGMVVCIPRFSSQIANVAASRKVVAKKSVEERGSAVVVSKQESETSRRPNKIYHIVKGGETLATIAGKYGIDKASLMSANNLKSDKVYPEMKLRLVSYTQKKEGKGPKYHVVKKGETLSTISSKYGTKPASLKSANNLKHDTVYPNMRLKIVEAEGRG